MDVCLCGASSGLVLPITISSLQCSEPAPVIQTLLPLMTYSPRE
jgi:hypothetical protein